MQGISSVFGTATSARKDVFDGQGQGCVQDRAGRARSRGLLESRVTSKVSSREEGVSRKWDVGDNKPEEEKINYI